MANANVPRGLVPYRRFDGQDWSAGVNLYFIPSGYAQNVFVGDPVISVSGSNDANGIPAINLAAAGGSSTPVLGSIVGIAPGGDPQVAVTRDQPIYHPASTAQYVLVADDPALIYMVQELGGGTPFLFSASGKNAQLNAGGGGSTITGYSSWQLDSGVTPATTNTFQVRLLRPLPQTDNLIAALGGTANTKWLVKLNFPQHLQTLGT